MADKNVLDFFRLETKLADVFGQQICRVAKQGVHQNQAFAGGHQVSANVFSADVVEIVKNLERLFPNGIELHGIHGGQLDQVDQRFAMRNAPGRLGFPLKPS